MLRITIELLPHGFEEGKRTMGVVEIANVGGTLELGDYRATLTKEPPIAKKRGVWKSCTVKGFPRKRLGPYDLLYRVLKACGMGERNKA